MKTQGWKLSLVDQGKISHVFPRDLRNAVTLPGAIRKRVYLSLTFFQVKIKTRVAEGCKTLTAADGSY